MATYVPNATDHTEPLESRTVESAALEFRTLKTRVNDLETTLEADDLADLRVPEVSVAVLPAIADRAGKVLGFDAGGDPTMVEVAGATDPSLRSDLAASSGASLVGANAYQTQDDINTQLFVGVMAHGAIGDGVTDDTLALQAALTASKNIYIPDGNYLVSSTLQVQPGGVVRGAGMLRTRIQRGGNWVGPTFRIGLSDGTVSAYDCEISGMLIEQLHPGFVLGTSITMVDMQTQEQSHIECYGGYNSKFADLWLQHGVYGISLWGCVVPELSDIRSFGAWDNQTAAVCEQKAVIRLASNTAVSGHSFCTEVRLDRVYIGTGAPSPLRTITVGTDISYLAYENVGSKAAVLINAVEGLEIVNSYMGGCAEDCIQFVPQSTTSMISIDNTFFDECFTSNIRFLPGTGPVTNVTIGEGCRFSGQFHTRNAIRAENNAGTPTVYGLNINGGIYGNTLETPFYLAAAKAVTISAPIVNNYNCKLSTDNNPAISAGGYFGALCEEVHVSGGLWGGGSNNWTTSNGCKWGPYFDTGSVGSVSNINAILGAAGGGVVGGKLQTYPGMESGIAVAYANSWVDFGAPFSGAAYYKDGFDLVHLTGAMRGGTMSLTSFTLPVGYRPATDLDFAVCGPDTFAAIRVTTAGSVVPIAGSNTRISLDGVIFRAA